MEKKRVVTSMEKITPEIRDLIAEQFPAGWKDNVIRINKPDGAFFHAIRVDTLETTFLVKVQVKVDNKADLEKEDEKGYGKDDGDDDGDDGESNDVIDESDDD